MKKLFTILFALFTIVSYAQISAERPGNGYNAITLPANEMQLEYGIGSYSNQLVNSFQIRAGVENFKRLEIKIGVSALGSDILGVNVGTKFGVTQHISGLFMVDIANPGLLDSTSRAYGYTLRGIVQKDFGSFTVCTNIGGGYFNEPFILFTAGVSYSNNIVVPYIEYSLYDNKSIYCVGVSRSLGKKVAIDFGLYADTKISRYEFGVSWNL